MNLVCKLQWWEKGSLYIELLASLPFVFVTAYCGLMHLRICYKTQHLIVLYYFYGWSSSCTNATLSCTYEKYMIYYVFVWSYNDLKFFHHHLFSLAMKSVRLIFYYDQPIPTISFYIYRITIWNAQVCQDKRFKISMEGTTIICFTIWSCFSYCEILYFKLCGFRWKAFSLPNQHYKV